MYTGPWITLSHPGGSQESIKKGSLAPSTMVHDDDAARALGFKEGIIGGLTLFSVTGGSIAASLGHTWFEGGVCSVKHKGVTYAGDVRVKWELVTPDFNDSRKIVYHLEDRDGNTAAHGWASLPKPGMKSIPPWERNPEVHKSVGVDIVPEFKVGTVSPPLKVIVHREDAIKNLDKISDYNWWYRIASPWGDPILTPYETAYMLYQKLKTSLFIGAATSPRFHTPMDAGKDMVFFQPLFLERTYTMKAKLIDKWQSGKTVFWCHEYSYEDENGKLVALMHANSAHMIKDLKPLAKKQ